MPTTSPSCSPVLWSTGHSSMAPTILSLGLTMLERLTELRETFYLLSYWLIIIGYNSEIARKKGKIPWRREWELPLVFLPGKTPRQRSLVGYSPWGCKELDTIEWLTHTHTHTHTHIHTQGMFRARYVGRSAELLCPLWAPLAPTSTSPCSPTQNLYNRVLLGF